MACYKQGSTWRYRKTITLPSGKITRISGTPEINSKTAAQQAEKHHIERELNPPVVVAAVPLFEDFAKTFLAAYEGQKPKAPKPSDVEAKKSIISTWLLPNWKGKPIDKIGKGDITLLSEKAGNRARHVLAVVSKMLKYAVSLDLLAAIPVFSRPARADVTTVIDRYSPEDFEELLGASASEPYWYAAILACGEAGLRFGELAALDWGQVDLDGRTLSVTRAVWQGQLGAPKSKHGRRTVGLTVRLCDALKSLPNRTGLVFRAPEGHFLSWDAARWGLKRMQTRAGVTVDGRWHRLRHTFVSMLADRGNALHDIKALAGHCSVTVTEGYAHPTTAGLRRAIDSLEPTNETNAMTQTVTNGLTKTAN